MRAHPQMRYAVAHWMGERMSLCFWTWQQQAQRRRERAGRVQAACRMFVCGSMGKAFNAWMGWALRKVGLLLVVGVAPAADAPKPTRQHPPPFSWPEKSTNPGCLMSVFAQTRFKVVVVNVNHKI